MCDYFFDCAYFCCIARKLYFKVDRKFYALLLESCCCCCYIYNILADIHSVLVMISDFPKRIFGCGLLNVVF